MHHLADTIDADTKDPGNGACAKGSGFSLLGRSCSQAKIPKDWCACCKPLCMIGSGHGICSCYYNTYCT